jgi:hypothetical protein
MPMRRDGGRTWITPAPVVGELMLAKCERVGASKVKKAAPVPETLPSSTTAPTASDCPKLAVQRREVVEMKSVSLHAVSPIFATAFCSNVPASSGTGTAAPPPL